MTYIYMCMTEKAATKTLLGVCSFWFFFVLFGSFGRWFTVVQIYTCVCGCVGVCEREREREK